MYALAYAYACQERARRLARGQVYFPDQLVASYQEATAGRDEPSCMEAYTPYGTVQLTPKLISGPKRAIRFAEKLFNAAQHFKFYFNSV